MAGPIANLSIGADAYKNIENIVGKAKDVKDDRDKQFKTQHKVKQFAYYVFMTLSVASLIALPICVAFAAINVSLGYLGYAAVATAALYAFSKLSSKFDSMSTDETQVYEKFKNPLGLHNNRDSVPEASALKGARVYFESLVAEKKTDKEKEVQKKKLQVAEKLFKTKIDKDELKQRIASLATTSMLLETIQHVYKNEQKQAQDILKQIGEGKLLESSSLIRKDSIKKIMMVQLGKPSKDFKDNLKVAIKSEKGHAVFGMPDLDKVLELAERYPNLAPAR